MDAYLELKINWFINCFMILNRDPPFLEDLPTCRETFNRSFGNSLSVADIQCQYESKTPVQALSRIGQA